MSGRGNRDLFDDGASKRAEIGLMREKVFKDIVWTHGVALLLTGGAKPENARSLLGKKMNELGAGDLARGILSAWYGQDGKAVADPLKYIAALRPRPKDEDAGESDVFERGSSNDDDVREPFWENEDEAPR